MLGLNHVKLFTAGGSGNLRIAGLAEEEAQTLRAVIEARTRR
jgi:membrane protein YdbS with pleckstrin-like domain